MLQEFKTFIAKGNAIDLAVGVVIGAAFGKIVTSVVDDLIMPLISLLLGKVDFSQHFVSLDGKSYATLAAAQEAGAATLNYGNFITGLVLKLAHCRMSFLLFCNASRWHFNASLITRASVM